jgi:eukaryotic-like serine/threonine-protein kinase
VTNQLSEFDPETRLGEILDQRYRIVAHLGTGGMASVYRAEHVHTSAKVAIKVLHPNLTDNAEISGRFRREALAARSIRHPNVVSVSDVGRLADGCSYMVLEYIPGEDLFVLLHREKPLSQARAVKIALQVANALVSAHAAGVVHRDLKPDNIMLIEREGDSDFVKVVDFGIAKVAGQGGPILTALGSVFGTPEYMAPEQARGAAVDPRTDLYTLGTVLYEMLSGRTPFEHEQFAQVLMGQISKAPPPLPPEIDPELAALVMTLLEKDPSRRVQTAVDLVARLQATLARLTQPQPAAPSPRAVASPPLPPSALHPMQPSALPVPARNTTQARSTTQTLSTVGCAIALVVLGICAFVLVRWIAAM